MHRCVLYYYPDSVNALNIQRVVNWTKFRIQKQEKWKPMLHVWNCREASWDDITNEMLELVEPQSFLFMWNSESTDFKSIEIPNIQSQ